MNHGDENDMTGVPGRSMDDDFLVADEVAFVLPDAEGAENDPDAIRAEIAETRDRMSSTLDEIGERLNPHRVTEQVKDSIREATIGRVETMAQQAADRVDDARRSVVDTVRDNPIPSAMVALGLGWMMWNSRSDSRSAASSYGGRSARGLAQWPGQGSSGYGERGYATGGYGGRSAGLNPNDADGGVVDAVRDRASALGGSVKDAAGSVGDAVKSVGGDLADRAQSVAGTVTESTRTGARRVEDTFYENPLLTGAVTLALGLAAGLAAPRTHPEVVLMGDVRDQAADRVRGIVQDTKHKAEHVAERVVNETKNAARDEGLAAPQQG